MKQENMYELIEDYLVGNLDGVALIQFENALHQDTELAKEVAVQKDILNALTPKPEDALLKNLRRLDSLYASKNTAYSKSDNE